jgi:CheY-like chemotaxis protein
MVARHLGSTHISIDETTTAGDAIAAAYRRKYDVIIFDMQLPDDDGLSLARAIRSDPALSGTRLLLLTSFGRRRSDVVAFENAGIDRFLVKPIRRSQLCDTVARLIDGEAESPVRMEMPQLPAPKRARVLLVEDNSVNQLVALGQLRKLGHDCVIAASGAEALAALPDGQFDVVLMDCSMPDMDGYETTRRMRQLDTVAAQIPIIAITAHALPGEREKCLAAGMNDYLAKPVAMEQLGAMIKLWTSKDSSKATADPCAEVMADDDHFVLDRERVSSLMAISRTQEGFLEGLVRTFKQDVPSRIDSLRAAAASGDPDDLAFAAHALKSSCGSVGARRMYVVASTLEQKVRAGRLEGVNASIEQLAAEFPRVLEAYSGIIKRSGQHRPAGT